MNYIWDLLVKAKQEEKQLKKINFNLPTIYSPYMELSSKEINFTEIKEEIEKAEQEEIDEYSQSALDEFSQ